MTKSTHRSMNMNIHHCIIELINYDGLLIDEALIDFKNIFDHSIIDVDINSTIFIRNIDVSILLIADGIIIRIVIVIFFCYQIVAHAFVDIALSMSA